MHSMAKIEKNQKSIIKGNWKKIHKYVHMKQCTPKYKDVTK